VLTTVKGFSLPEVATAMFTLSLAFRSGHFFTGPFVDSTNVKTCLVIGVFLTGLSFWTMAYVNTLPLLIACIILAGCGHSTNALASKSFVSNFGGKDGNSLIYFSTINVFVNAAAAVGSLLGSYLLASKLTSHIFQIVAAFYVVAGVIVLLMLQQAKNFERSLKRVEFWNGYRKVLSDQGYLKFLSFNFVGWFCYTQMFTALPYFASIRYGMDDKLGLLYMLNALMIILLQLPVSVYMNKLLPQGKETHQFFFAYLLFSLAFLIAGVYQSFIVLFLIIILFTLAEMLFTPLVDTMVCNYTKAGLNTTYFSVLGISKALGEGFGSYFGLRLLGFWVQRNQYSWFWLSLAVLVWVASLSLWLTVRSKCVPK